jgi:hypothetical protein
VRKRVTTNRRHTSGYVDGSQTCALIEREFPNLEHLIEVAFVADAGDDVGNAREAFLVVARDYQMTLCTGVFDVVEIEVQGVDDRESAAVRGCSIIVDNYQGACSLLVVVVVVASGEAARQRE